MPAAEAPAEGIDESSSAATAAATAETSGWGNVSKPAGTAKSLRSNRKKPGRCRSSSSSNTSSQTEPGIIR